MSVPSESWCCLELTVFNQSVHKGEVYLTLRSTTAISKLN